MLYPLVGLATVVMAAIAYYLTTRYAAGDAHEGHLALTGATALIGSDLEPRSGTTVLIRDGIIVEVADDGAIDIPPGAIIRDLSGSTLMPGLIDLHVHLGAPQLERGEDVGMMHMPRIILDTMRHVPDARRAYLDHGVTAVRSLGDEYAWVMELRRMLADGELEGPRLFAAGPLFTTPGGHPVVTIGVEPQSDTVRLPSSPDEARRIVRELAGGDDPVDVIKVVQERGSRTFAMDPLAPDVLRAIVDEAHSHDIPVSAHWGTLDDLEDVLAAGVDDLQHLEARGTLGGWPEELLASLVERRIPLAPTLAVSEVGLRPQVHQRLREQLATFHAAGGRVVVGSDAGMPGVRFGAGVHRELELLVDSGLSPRDALRAATSEAALVLGADHIGTIAPGRAADLVVVDGDPLEDIEAVRDVILVLRDGRAVVDRRT